MRKNRDQLKALKRAYQECQGTWTRDYQVYIAHQLGLTEQQVYKWSWDQLQKRRTVTSGRTSSSDSQRETHHLCGTKTEKRKTSSCTDEYDEAIDHICGVLGIDMNDRAVELVQ